MKITYRRDYIPLKSQLVCFVFRNVQLIKNENVILFDLNVKFSKVLHI